MALYATNHRLAQKKATKMNFMFDTRIGGGDGFDELVVAYVDEHFTSASVNMMV